MPDDTDKPTGFDSLRLSQRDLDAVFAQMDRANHRFNGANVREHERFDLPEQWPLVARVHDPSGSAIDFLVQGRNLSRTGISFLHGGYIHQGTVITAIVQKLDGSVATEDGYVVRCRHITGNVHEIGMRFDNLLHLDQFIPDLKTTTEPSEHDDTLPHFRGRVLYVEDAVDDRTLMQFLCKKMGLTIEMATTVEEGARLAGEQHFDMLMCDTWLGESAGVDMVKTCRRAGFSGPIVMVSTEDTDDARQQAFEAGATFVMPKPIRREPLAQVFDAFLEPDTNHVDTSKPLYSTQWQDKAMRPLILAYLGRLPKQTRQLIEHLDVNDVEAIRRFCLSLRSTADGYGYPPIAKYAEHIADAAMIGSSVASLRAKADSLSEIIEAACKVRAHVKADR